MHPSQVPDRHLPWPLLNEPHRGGLGVKHRVPSVMPPDTSSCQYPSFTLLYHFSMSKEGFPLGRIRVKLIKFHAAEYLRTYVDLAHSRSALPSGLPWMIDPFEHTSPTTDAQMVQRTMMSDRANLSDPQHIGNFTVRSGPFGFAARRSDSAIATVSTSWTSGPLTPIPRHGPSADRTRDREAQYQGELLDHRSR